MVILWLPVEQPKEAPFLFLKNNGAGKLHGKADAYHECVILTVHFERTRNGKFMHPAIRTFPTRCDELPKTWHKAESGTRKTCFSRTDNAEDV